jgi:hypothetical protein
MAQRGEARATHKGLHTFVPFDDSRKARISLDAPQRRFTWWGVVIAAGTGFVVGVSSAIGGQVWHALWPMLFRWLPLAYAEIITRTAITKLTVAAKIISRTNKCTSSLSRSTGLNRSLPMIGVVSLAITSKKSAIFAAVRRAPSMRPL